jgi:hypothetical protein
MTGSKPKLHVVSTARQHFIPVPRRFSEQLVAYLRLGGLRVAPPVPCTGDSETVALLGKVELAAVQGLLDRWR